jgi:hypothetical protein
MSGSIPIANVNWRFKWLWLYGFVHPQSGETYWWILPFVNRCHLALQNFNLLKDFDHLQMSLLLSDTLALVQSVKKGNPRMSTARCLYNTICAFVDFVDSTRAPKRSQMGSIVLLGEQIKSELIQHPHFL